MGYPFKKPIDRANRGLDLLSAAIDARGTIAPPSALTAKASGCGDGEESSNAPEASTSHSETAAPSRHNKRARPFPAVLRDILSDPDHQSVVSWLPQGRSFAVHDTHKFSTEVLPKYFKKVVFRSFARKLNRWGFRSVKRCASGHERATFEHPLFRRDDPELSEGMKCRSNPAANKGPEAAAPVSQAQDARRTLRAPGQAVGAAVQIQAIPAIQAQDAGRTLQAPGQAVPAQPVPLQAPTHDLPLPTAPAHASHRPTISPSGSVASAGAASAVPHVPGTAPADREWAARVRALRNAHAEEVAATRLRDALAARLRDELPRLVCRELRNARAEELVARLREERALRELQRVAREREVLRFLRETPASDAVSRHIAENLRRRMLEQRRGQGGY